MRTDTETTPTTQADATPTPAPKPTTPVKAKANGSKPVKAATKKAPPSNVVTLAQLCKEAKVETKVARVRLRASKLKKSADGWQWQKGSAVIKEVRKVIAGD